MYDVHIEVESLVYIYVYVGSRTIFFPVHRSIADHNPYNMFIITMITLVYSKNLPTS